MSDAVAIDPDRLQAIDAVYFDRLEPVGTGVEQSLAGCHDAVAVITRPALNSDVGACRGVLIIKNRNRVQADVVDEGAQFVFSTGPLEAERIAGARTDYKHGDLLPDPFWLTARVRLSAQQRRSTER